jgi:hypothetical protein
VEGERDIDRDERECMADAAIFLWYQEFRLIRAALTKKGS